MKLKRIYDIPENWQPIYEIMRDQNGNPILDNDQNTIKRLTNAPPLKGIEIQNTGTHAQQNFSTGLVLAAITEGWMAIDGAKLTIKAAPENLNYKIIREPGKYCLHCGEKLTDDANNEMAKMHVMSKHAGQESPDATNPAGYAKINHFECILDAKQHTKFKAQKLGGK